MRVLEESSSDKVFIGEAVCDCGEMFVFGISDKEQAETPSEGLTNMVRFGRFGIPYAKCPKCGAVEEN